MTRTIENSAVLEDLVARLRRLTPNQTRVWGSMNSQQMALHLGDACAAVLKQRPFASQPRRPSPVRKFVVLHLLRRLPRGIRTAANPAAKVVEPGAFAAGLERAVNLLQALAAAPAEVLADRHPLLGPMSRRDWMRWGYLHTDHHLRQFAL